MKPINLLNYCLNPLGSACAWFAIVGSTALIATSVSAQTAPSPAATPSKPRVTFFESESKQDFRFSFENFLSSALDGVANLSTTDSTKTNPAIDSTKTNPAIPYSSTSLPGSASTVTVPGTITTTTTPTTFTFSTTASPPPPASSVTFSGPGSVAATSVTQQPNTSNIPAGSSTVTNLGNVTSTSITTSNPLGYPITTTTYTRVDTTTTTTITGATTTIVQANPLAPSSLPFSGSDR